MGMTGRKAVMGSAAADGRTTHLWRSSVAVVPVLVDPDRGWIYLVHPFSFAPTLAEPGTFAADSVFRIVAGETRARVMVKVEARR